jgi:diaminohydroxyphosphoribosylaminopyrimidine deaminase/5-amino-6-(5-phosphoribosylamino)uracil reductase
MNDALYMRRALRLAKKGEGWTSPNPMVGAVIVKNGKIIGEGYHRRYGENHAEINAIDSASDSIEGATFYITLEPCTHYGKTPPCVDRIVASKPARVVVGATDPNPLVSGRGIECLKRNGIEVKTGVLQEKCIKLNERYFKFTTTGVPFVTLKYAQTIDGRIASSTGHSKWISSDSSLRFAHTLRGRHDAVMVGIGTVLVDDPDLTLRLARGRNPTRLVIDPHLTIPTDARILRNQEYSRTMVIYGTRYNGSRLSHLRNRGIETIAIPEHDENHIDLRTCLIKLGERGISSILVEGGARIITSFMKERLANKLIIITAPKIMGRGVEAVGNLGILKVNDSIRIDIVKISRKGTDIIIEATFEK